MKASLFTLALFPLASVIYSAEHAQLPSQTDAAQNVIQNFLDHKKVPLKLELIDKKDNRDEFETQVTNGTLTIKGSSGVALCRGFYDFLKSDNKGINSWTGNRVDLPAKLPDTPAKKVTSPFEHHFYFNPVTYGYTLPYWDWKRWSDEIDWMALHGLDMPLALVANEAIATRVWKKLGLTDEEIGEFYTGPAHLPWQRMGNASGIDAPLPPEWHKDQIALQHKILDKMKSLGMKPICPGFAGFVPQALKRLYPDVNIVETHWAGFKNWMLDPKQELFTKIGTMFIQEWEKEFGKNDYYLIDSFNEMEIPFPPKGSQERYDLLADYGNNVYTSLKNANPDAVWVMQGWMFGYQRYIWEPETLAALIKNVPDDKMLLIDEAVDYNKDFWRNGYNWDFYKGYFNKPWIFSYIPNMGGKSGMTGFLSTYANAHLDALNSPNKGRLVGHGMAPEGTENNEVIYELITDAGWSNKPINLNQWLIDYTQTRYGKSTNDIMSAWEGFLQSVYGSFTDHPRYNWQFRPGLSKKGSINANNDFYAAIESFAKAAKDKDLANNPLFTADLVEYTAAYIGGKLEHLIAAIENAYLYDDLDQAQKLEKQFTDLMLGMDSVLATHPTATFERWLDFSQKHASDDKLNAYYEKNARRLLTIWGPPINDYSARIWSGLIRDYYLPRWQHYFQSKKDKKAFNFDSWEADWVTNKRGLSKPKPCKNVIATCLSLLDNAKTISTDAPQSQGTIIASWTPQDLSEEWKEVTWNIPSDIIHKVKSVVFDYVKGSQRLEMKSITIEMDGKNVCTIDQEGMTGLEDKNNIYNVTIPAEATGNNSCKLKATIRSTNSCDSFGNVEVILSKQK